MKNILTKKNIIILAIILLICLLIFFTCFKTGGAVHRTIDFSRVESVEVVKFADEGDNGMYTIEKSVTLSGEDIEELEELIQSSIYRTDRSSSHDLVDIDNRYCIKVYDVDEQFIGSIWCVDNHIDIWLHDESAEYLSRICYAYASNKNWSQDMGNIFQNAYSETQFQTISEITEVYTMDISGYSSISSVKP